MKKLTEIYRLLENDQAKSILKPTTIAAEPKKDPSSEEDSAALLIINKIESLPDVIKALRQVQTPTGKYKLLLQFAQMLGISQEEFHNTIANMQIYQKQNEE